MNSSLLKGKVCYEKVINPNEWTSLYGSELKHYAARNFKGYIALLYFLLKIKGMKFDLIVGAGDSGYGMVTFAELVYNVLHIPVPAKIMLPLQRYKNPETYWSDNPDDFYDNASILPEVKEQLKDVLQVKNVLYVDDEISYVGLTAKEIAKLLLKAFPAEKFTFTIVAEDQGLLWRENDPKVNVNLYSICESVDKLYGVIFRLIPSEIEHEFSKVFHEQHIDVKAYVNILMGFPTKDLKDGKLVFSDRLSKLAEHEIPNLSRYKKEFKLYINRLIKEGIEDYINKKIRIEVIT